MINKHKQAGLTLIEMMIAMVLGLFVIAVIITVFSTNVRSSTESIKMIRLNQELRGVMTMMVDELKRAGYSADPSNSDFMSDFDINDFDTSDDCARYSYDDDGDKIQDANEKFGFRLNGNIVEWSRNVTSADCSAPASSTWDDLTDPALASITTLYFDITDSINTGGIPTSPLNALTTTTGLSVYDVTITLTGTTDLPPNGPDANDPRRTITETIRVRNEDPKD